ncbi:hypothetical protein PG985_013991 [Apiospora marii]|uniref:uncharacterized protein n=1 Tax=Apiospora marii TaxID=335849 RepID=UPI00312D6539
MDQQRVPLALIRGDLTSTSRETVSCILDGVITASEGLRTHNHAKAPLAFEHVNRPNINTPVSIRRPTSSFNIALTAQSAQQLKDVYRHATECAREAQQYLLGLLNWEPTPNKALFCKVILARPVNATLQPILPLNRGDYTPPSAVSESEPVAKPTAASSEASSSEASSPPTSGSDQPATTQARENHDAMFSRYQTRKVLRPKALDPASFQPLPGGQDIADDENCNIYAIGFPRTLLTHEFVNQLEDHRIGKIASVQISPPPRTTTPHVPSERPCGQEPVLSD